MGKSKTVYAVAKGNERRWEAIGKERVGRGVLTESEKARLIFAAWGVLNRN